MKTKFVWIPYFNLPRGRTKDVCDFEYYEEFYKEHGWLWDQSMEEIHLVIDEQINLSRGDKIQFAYVGCPYVHYVEYDAIDNMMIYYIRENEPEK